MDQLEREIATDEHSSLLRERLVECRRQRTDGGNRGDAKRDAQHEDGKSARARAQFAQCNAQRQGKFEP